ncbi:PREDICTED: zinc transporter 3 isoform X1 [Hipposideros armiger]|uniref:Probable proton-coupled zinc antiporter SLC30A3 n=1 Tax=Hipposideros armiger TaxID=186990 RepID=A0A8B7QW95_HIPAR|nr:PREDICTED: zinc transporter 3 isoform X1 [Hipposideros armiger]
MEPSPATGGLETTRLVSPRDRGGAGGGLRLKSLFTEPSEPFPEEPKAVEMPSHHCHRDPLPQLGLTPERLQAQRQLCAACAVCCVFMAGEVVGGYLAHSLAIMTDAAHLLADVGSMMGSLFSLWLSTRPATRTMTFGWHRSETLGALASVVSLWMVTGILLYLAFIRLLHSDYHIEGGAMLLTASIAVCANLLMAFVLHQAGPPHSHGSRGAEYAPLEEGPGEPLPLRNTSVRAAFVHVLGDLLQSFGVLAASILIYFKTPQQTLKLSWPKPHPSSTLGLDSPALPCRSSSTSLRWPSACAAGSPPSPELTLPSPHCQALAQPWTLSTCLPSHRQRAEPGPYPLLSPLLSPASSPAPSPSGQDQSVCVGEWVGSQAEQGISAVGICGNPGVPAPTVWGAASILSVQFICLCGSLAGLGHLPICVLSVCLCLGEVSRGPSSHGPRSVYAGAPKLALCPCVALWFSLCVRVCVCVCVCAFLGAVACVSLCLCGCAMVSMSLHHPCVRLGVCVHPSVGAVPLAIPERGKTRPQLHQ